MKPNNKQLKKTPKNKSAFTLIELLAIIVILALIAVITIPVILKVIDNSKKGSAIDSAYRYSDAVKKSFLEQLSIDPTMDLPTGIFILGENNKLEGDEEITINASGIEPSAGSWIELKRGEVVAYSLKIGEYIVTKYENEEIKAVKNTQISLKPEDKKLEDIKALANIKVNRLLNGNTNNTGIFEFNISDSEQKEWIAKLNGETIGYSVKVETNGTSYIVTKNGDTVTVEEIIDDFTIGDKSTCENQIINYCKEIAITKINNIITSISSDNIKSSMLEQAQSSNDNISIKVLNITSITKPNEMDNNSWVYYTYTKSPASVSVSDYSIAVTESGYTFVKNMTNGTATDVAIGTVGIQKQAGPIISWTLSYNGNDVNYYDGAWVKGHPVYYDPINNIMNCTNYHTNNSNFGYNGINKVTAAAGGGTTTTNETGVTSCLKWYRYSEYTVDNIKYTNLLLDHDVANAYWKTSSNNSTLNGPGQLLTALKNRTDAWIELNTITSPYYTASWKYSNTNYSYTVPLNTETYKAKIISAQEIANITGAARTNSNGGIGWNEHTSTNKFYFNSTYSTSNSGVNTNYNWLYSSHYWTISPLNGLHCRAWIIYSNGSMDEHNADYNYGVRPVITISE